MQSCIFCQIAARTGKAKIVFEDDQVVAFEDIHPIAPIHVLVIPKKHIPTLNDVEPSDHPLIGRMFQAAATIARDRGIAEKGYRTIFNVNAGAGQTVYHIHLHVLGGKTLSWG